MKAMKLEKQNIFIIVFLLFVISCRKETNQQSINLVYPNNEEISLLAENFVWETTSKSAIELVILDTKTSGIILDTLLNGSSFVIKNLLLPNREYTWKVKSEGITESAKFTTRDIIGYFEGKYKFVGKAKCWGGASACDTSIITQIELIKNGEEIRLIEEFTKMDKSNKLRLDLGHDSSLFYLNEYPFMSTITLNQLNDSIHITYCKCGLGGGQNWIFDGKKN